MNGQKMNSMEIRLKQLEFLQGVINRLATNSANLKNYCITLAAALIGLSSAIQQQELLYFCSPLIAIFAYLDAHYLQLERGFRLQFNDLVATELSEKAGFKLSQNENSTSSIFFSVDEPFGVAFLLVYHFTFCGHRTIHCIVWPGILRISDR